MKKTFIAAFFVLIGCRTVSFAQKQTVTRKISEMIVDSQNLAISFKTGAETPKAFFVTIPNRFMPAIFAAFSSVSSFLMISSVLAVEFCKLLFIFKI
jgi:hypothetical protein